MSRSNQPSTGDYSESVFDPEAPIPDQLAQIKEYCLCLREWRLEDGEHVRKLAGRLKALEDRQRAMKKQMKGA